MGRFLIVLLAILVQQNAIARKGTDSNEIWRIYDSILVSNKIELIDDNISDKRVFLLEGKNDIRSNFELNNNDDLNWFVDDHDYYGIMYNYKMGDFGSLSCQGIVELDHTKLVESYHRRFSYLLLKNIKNLKKLNESLVVDSIISTFMCYGEVQKIKFEKVTQTILGRQGTYFDEIVGQLEFWVHFKLIDYEFIDGEYPSVFSDEIHYTYGLESIKSLNTIQNLRPVIYFDSDERFLKNKNNDNFNRKSARKRRLILDLNSMNIISNGIISYPTQY